MFWESFVGNADNIVGNADKYINVSNKYLHHVYVFFYQLFCLESKNVHILKINFSAEENMAQLDFTYYLSHILIWTHKQKSKHNVFGLLWLNSENRLYVYACYSFYYYSTAQILKLYSLNIANY